jgi:DNA-directed RNA polymerase specialized sigma subunit
MMNGLYHISLRVFFLYIYVGKIEMKLSAEAARFVPIVKTIASIAHRNLVPETDEQQLVDFGLSGLIEGLAQYKSRQGLTQREFLTYKIRGAIYAGLAAHQWPAESRKEKYLFLKKTNELLLNFHLSAEGAIKRSVKAEEEEVLRLLRLLAIIGLLCRTKSHHSPEVQDLDPEGRQFLRLYYDEDFDLKAISEKMRISEGSAFRLLLRILEQLADKFCREYK